MEIAQILNLDLGNLPYIENISDINTCDGKRNISDIYVFHSDFYPNKNTEREQSQFNDCLSNLENTVISEFFKSLKNRKPKSYYNKTEILTDSIGGICHLSKSAN